MRYTILFFFSFALCFSCAKKRDVDSSENTEVIKVNFSHEYKERKFPNTNLSMTIQKLEDNENIPIGYIDKLIIENKRIYILDKSKAKSLFVYKISGELLNIINQIGVGPGEFTSPQDFDIFKKTGDIAVLDANMKKILLYSPEGEFYKEIKLNSFATNIKVDFDGNILIDNGNIPSGENPHYLKKINLEGELLGEYFPANPSTLGITFNPRNPLQESGGKIFYLPAMSRSLYVLNDNCDPTEMYRTDFGDYWPSDDYFETTKKTHPLKIRESMINSGYVCFVNYIQTTDVVHVDFYKDKKYSLYYNKNTKQTLLLEMKDPDISFPMATYDNQFVFVKYSSKTGEPIIVFYTVNFDL